jgi:hypothetical protein
VRRTWSLSELKAKWLPVPKPRYNGGFSFRCPVHEEHRLVVVLVNPYDGGKPIDEPGVRAVMVANGGLGTITCMSPSGHHALDFKGCGLYAIICGHVEELTN